MNKDYFDTSEEFLKKDNSYLLVYRNISNVFSKAFWWLVDKAKLKDSVAGTKGNQRESYEAGVLRGWEMAVKKLESNGNNPNPVGLSKQELNDVMFILNAFGVKFIYMNEPPSCIRTEYTKNNFHPGLNICKNIDAINARVTVDSDVKQKIIEILKAHTPQKMWPSK